MVGKVLHRAGMLFLSPSSLKNFVLQILSLTLRWRPKESEQSCTEGQDSLYTGADPSRGEEDTGHSKRGLDTFSHLLLYLGCGSYQRWCGWDEEYGCTAAVEEVS